MLEEFREGKSSKIWFIYENMHIQKHSNDCKTEKKNFKNKVRVLSIKNSFQKVKALSNKRLPNVEKSDM